MSNIAPCRDIHIYTDGEGRILLSFTSNAGYLCTEITQDQLRQIKDDVDLVFNPNKSSEELISRFKKMARDAFTKYKTSKDPEVKAQSLEVYKQIKMTIDGLNARSVNNG